MKDESRTRTPRRTEDVQPRRALIGPTLASLTVPPTCRRGWSCTSNGLQDRPHCRFREAEALKQLQLGVLGELCPRSAEKGAWGPGYTRGKDRRHSIPDAFL